MQLVIIKKKKLDALYNLTLHYVIVWRAVSLLCKYLDCVPFVLMVGDLFVSCQVTLEKGILILIKCVYM